LGNEQLNKLLAAMNVPQMTWRTYKNHE